jgi:hypothetical protein
VIVKTVKPIRHIPAALMPPQSPAKPAPIWPLDTAEERLKRIMREDAKHGHIWKIANSR